MTKLEVASLIASFGIAWRYSHFSETPTPPYCVYYYPNENDVFADDSNYVNRRSLFIELFTVSKDYTPSGATSSCEATIESTLKSNGLTYYKQTDYLNDEKLFQTTYEMEVIING